MSTLAEMKQSGVYDLVAWPGCYPLVYLEDDNSIVCPACANAGKATDIISVYPNFEDTEMYCDYCGERIEAAYEG